MKATIENQINSIFNSLTSSAAEGLVVKKEQPSKYSPCKAVISLYSANDLKRQEEEAAKAKAKRAAGDPSAPKPFKARPVVTYAIYPKVSRPSELGSVAIYGANAVSRCVAIRRMGVIFGLPVADARVEMGLRPFVDVKVAA